MVEFYKNDTLLRTFSRNLATDRKSDEDMVSFDHEVCIFQPMSRDFELDFQLIVELNLAHFGQFMPILEPKILDHLTHFVTTIYFNI